MATVLSTIVETLDWSDKLALINHYHVDDFTACEVFDVTEAELQAAVSKHKAGKIEITTTIDVDKYKGLFEARSATKVVKKRGRKGTKIADAFNAITLTPQPVDQFIDQQGVSLAVLRQHKRFDVSGLAPVKVKKIRVDGNENKILCIWREAE
jgi:hypothetical protein